MPKLWGSRFKKGTDKLADHFSFSIGYDYRLAVYDVMVGIAHAKMLGKCRIISLKESSQIIAGLKKIGKHIENGTFKFDPQAEDIHTNIQTVLKKLIGEPADKLHTARSRNDLIVTDMKLYCLVELNHLINLVAELQKAIVTVADNNRDVIIPAYTHLQSAQVVLLPHYLLAYVEMFERDKERLIETFMRIDKMPLGSCALAGTTLAIDREFVSRELGFLSPTANSVDSVSDRDFIIEFLSNAAILGTHFSRIAEDFIIWSTKEFNMVDIDWSLCTGSSMMPHKKNPDILELIRGESSTLISNLNQILILVKGLPLTYNRDLQLDKPPLFESVEKIKQMLLLMGKFFSTLKFKKYVIQKRISDDESFFCVDIMEFLIKKGVSYRDAHDAVGRMVKECLDQGKTISDLSETQLKKYSPQLTGEVKKLLNPEMSVKMKKSLGSTNPQFVAKQIERWKKL